MPRILDHKDEADQPDGVNRPADETSVDDESIETSNAVKRGLVPDNSATDDAVNEGVGINPS